MLNSYCSYHHCNRVIAIFPYTIFTLPVSCVVVGCYGYTNRISINGHLDMLARYFSGSHDNWFRGLCASYASDKYKSKRKNDPYQTTKNKNTNDVTTNIIRCITYFRSKHFGFRLTEYINEPWPSTSPHDIFLIQRQYILRHHTAGSAVYFHEPLGNCRLSALSQSNYTRQVPSKESFNIGHIACLCLH